MDGGTEGGREGDRNGWRGDRRERRRERGRVVVGPCGEWMEENQYAEDKESETRIEAPVGLFSSRRSLGHWAATFLLFLYLIIEG